MRALGRIWPLPAALVLAVALVLVRGRPSTDSDAGIFLSVGARLLEGDRLYADVWDNKDPLFYYAYAGALATGDWRAPFLLDVLWLTLAGAGAALLLRKLGTTTRVAALGLVSYPLLLTGAYYYAGYSMLPALGLVPFTGWLWLRRQAVLCGVVVAVGALLKANLGLVLVSLPVALGLLGLPAGSRRGPFVRAAGGLVGGLAVGGALLAALGELRGYLDVLRDNVAYAGDVLAATDRPTGVYGHVWSAAGVTDYTWAVVAFCLVGLAVAVPALRRRPGTEAALGALFLAGAASTAVTLAATAVWDHHAQLLAVPGFLLVALLATAAERLPRPERTRLGIAFAATVACLAAFGALSEPPGIANGASWRASGGSALADALEEADPAGHASYAVLGRNNELGHAAFLDGDWRLACPRFHQYPFSPRLAEVVSCIDRRRPRFVLVAAPIGPDASQPRAWNRFVGAATALLRRSYVRVRLTGGHGAAEVWRLRAAA
ncbi:MAG TPA: hypothetical protein VLB86_06800 [Gaiellaceae bacterium]|nr:hypothetical protein [Gaiellaceae bacterium]